MLPPLLLAGLLAACNQQQVVLQGVPPEPLLQDQPNAAESTEARPGPSEVYVRPQGVHVDVEHLGGRSFREFRDVLADQLGTLQQTTQLPGGDGVEYRFERGTVRVLDDDIYMLLVPLPEPLRRTDALVLLGFPAQVDRYLTLHREYRLNNELGFRRIRLKRQSRDSELVTEVEAWVEVPGESPTVR